MEIHQIKQQLTLSQVLDYYHLKPDKHQRLHCPFHNDKTPSMQVYHKTNSCYCFSTNCKTNGKSLDVIDFILHKEGCSKREAILKAKELTGVTHSRLPQKPTENQAGFLTKMFTYFKKAIHNSKPAKEYLQSRCLDKQKTEVGYNSGQFHHGSRRNDQLIQSCLKYGLLSGLNVKSKTGNPIYKPFGKCGLVFPLKNLQNEIVSLYFRSIINNNKNRHFYLKGRQGLYPKYPGKDTMRLLLTESIIDAATLLEQEKIKDNYEVLALFGTNGLTQEHQQAIKGLPALEEIIFFLNGDQAGIKAVEKYAPMFKGEYPKVKITNVQVPENEDVNSLLQGHSADILAHLIETRKEYSFLFSNGKSNETALQPVNPDKNKSASEQKETPGQEAEPTKPKQTGLDTNSPHNLKYAGNGAQYQVKGFRAEQLDSLKITLQIERKRGS